MSLFGSKGGRGEEGEPAAPPGEPRPGAPETSPPAASPNPEAGTRSGRETVANIGKSITIKGDLTGSEDLVVEGTVEGGRIELSNNELTIGTNGKVSAEIQAKSVVVIGKVSGNVTASEKIEIQSSGAVQGDVRAPRLIVQEGAVLNGAVETSKEPKPARPSPSPPLAKTGTSARLEKLRGFRGL